MMSVRWFAVLLAAAMAPAAARGGVVEERALAEAEARACEARVAEVEARRRLVETGADLHRDPLAAAEVALEVCVERQRLAASRADEEIGIRREVARRLTPRDDSPERRAELERQVRLERARAKPAGRRSAADEALLAGESARAAAAERDRRWALDPTVRRTALSASLCRAEQERQLAAGALDLARDSGDGDRTAGYAAQSRLRRAQEVVAGLRGEAAALGGPLPCTESLVWLLTRCLDGGVERPVACEDEGLQPFIRLAN